MHGLWMKRSPKLRRRTRGPLMGARPRGMGPFDERQEPWLLTGLTETSLAWEGFSASHSPKNRHHNLKAMVASSAYKRATLQ